MMSIWLLIVLAAIFLGFMNCLIRWDWDLFTFLFTTGWFLVCLPLITFGVPALVNSLT